MLLRCAYISACTSLSVCTEIGIQIHVDKGMMQQVTLTLIVAKLRHIESLDITSQ